MVYKITTNTFTLFAIHPILSVRMKHCLYFHLPNFRYNVVWSFHPSHGNPKFAQMFSLLNWKYPIFFLTWFNKVSIMTSQWHGETPTLSVVMTCYMTIKVEPQYKLPQTNYTSCKSLSAISLEIICTVATTQEHEVQS